MDLGSGIRVKKAPDPGSRIRIRNTAEKGNYVVRYLNHTGSV